MTPCAAGRTGDGGRIKTITDASGVLAVDGHPSDSGLASPQGATLRKIRCAAGAEPEPCPQASRSAVHLRSRHFIDWEIAGAMSFPPASRRYCQEAVIGHYL